jgi:hypothetical protein
VLTRFENEERARDLSPVIPPEQRKQHHHQQQKL